MLLSTHPRIYRLTSASFERGSREGPEHVHIIIYFNQGSASLKQKSLYSPVLSHTDLVLYPWRHIDRVPGKGILEPLIFTLLALLNTFTALFRSWPLLGSDSITEEQVTCLSMSGMLKQLPV